VSTHFQRPLTIGRKRSIQSYTGAVLRRQRFYNKPLHDITEEPLRQYWRTETYKTTFTDDTRNRNYFSLTA
jgi:hypothetical protein